MSTQRTIRCRLDGKQSVIVPVILKKNGRFLTDPINIIIRGFLKFETSGGDSDEPSIFTTDSYQKESANLLENKTIVYPVLFTSRKITIYNGQGTITLLPRSEDILIDFDSLQSRLGEATAVSEDKENGGVLEEEIVEKEDTQIIIQTGIERQPYNISIEVTIVDDNGQYYGQTFDGPIDAEDDNSQFEQTQRQLTSNLIVKFYNDIDWIPSVEQVITDNEGTSSEVLSAINNIANEVPFGSSAMYDALALSSEILSNNTIDALRKIIYLLTDNDTNMSINNANDVIDNINAIDGFKKVPVLTGNLSLAKPVTLSVKANTTDTKDLNKLGFLTGGQSVTVVDEEDLDEIVNIFYGEAVGALGYGTYEFVVDLGEVVTIDSITGNFEIPDNRANASWEIEISQDGYTFAKINQTFDVDDVFEENDIFTRYIKFKIILITGFASDEYLGLPSSPLLNSFEIVYNQEKTVYLFLRKMNDGISPFQMILAVDSNSPESNQIKVGIAKSDAHNWFDFSNQSQPKVDQNGKIVIPLRFSQDTSVYEHEPLSKIDRFTLKTSYGSWDTYASVTVYDATSDLIPNSDYRVFPRDGIVVFNTILPIDYADGDYHIGILNSSDYKIGLKLKNKSNKTPLEIYGIGKMYTTGKDLLPPIEKLPPEAREVLLNNPSPDKYSIMSVDYTYFDYNFDQEDTSQLEITWYINGIHINYLDNLTTWNDLDNSLDPLYQKAFSFTLNDLELGETAEKRARTNNESILNVGDNIHCFVQVSDGELFSVPTQSDSAIVVEGSPTISQLTITGLTLEGQTVERISTNHAAVVSFNFLGDTDLNQSDIIWYVNDIEFKRGPYGSVDEESGNLVERLVPGETSLNTLDVALRMSNKIYVQIVPRTEGAAGEPITSEEKFVDNALPEIGVAGILPVPAREDVNLTLTWEFKDWDIDGLDDATQTEQTTVVWHLKVPPASSGDITIFHEITVDGIYADIFSSINTSIASHVSTIDNSVLSPNQEWKVVITPNDDIEDGVVKEVGPITIRSR